MSAVPRVKARNKRRSVASPRRRREAVAAAVVSSGFAPESETVRLAAKVLRGASVPAAKYSEALSALSQTLAELQVEDFLRQIAAVPVPRERDIEGSTEERRKKVTKARSHRRPRRSVAAVAAEERGGEEIAAPEAPLEPPQARLIRRADVVHERAPAAREPFLNGPRRSVVKWFDDKHRRGALHVPGIGSEVAISGAALDAFGVHRLFRGQEVTVEVVAENGGVSIVSLALPSESAGPSRAFSAAASGGRRLSVVVEDKRKALQRVGAKLKAESVFSKNRVPDGSND